MLQWANGYDGVGTMVLVQRLVGIDRFVFVVVASIDASLPCTTTLATATTLATTNNDATFTLSFATPH